MHPLTADAADTLVAAWANQPTLGWPALACASLGLILVLVGFAMLVAADNRGTIVKRRWYVTIVGGFAVAFGSLAPTTLAEDAAEDALKVAVAHYLAETADLQAAEPIDIYSSGLTVPAVDEDGRTHQVRITFPQPQHLTALDTGEPITTNDEPTVTID